MRKAMNVDHEQKLMKLALSKMLEKEVIDATAFCKATIQQGDWLKPSGVSATVQTVPEVKDKLAKMNASDSLMVVFGGCLGLLDLDHRIHDSSLMDLGRMRWACARLDQDQKFSKLGPISVRMDSALQRLERDADVDVMLLSIYWHKPTEAGAQHPLMHMCQDIVFHAESVPPGLELEIERFKRMADEQKMKDVMGRSAWRLSLDMKVILKMGEVERKEGQSDGDLLAACLAKKPELKLEWGGGHLPQVLVHSWQVERPEH